MNVKGFIVDIREEIEQLKLDKERVVSEVAKSSLQRSINNREDRIAELTKKYLTAQS